MRKMEPLDDEVFRPLSPEEAQGLRAGVNIFRSNSVTLTSSHDLNGEPDSGLDTF